MILLSWSLCTQPHHLVICSKTFPGSHLSHKCEMVLDQNLNKRLLSFLLASSWAFKLGVGPLFPLRWSNWLPLSMQRAIHLSVDYTKVGHFWMDLWYLGAACQPQGYFLFATMTSLWHSQHAWWGKRPNSDRMLNSLNIIIHSACKIHCLLKRHLWQNLRCQLLVKSQYSVSFPLFWYVHSFFWLLNYLNEQ